MYFGKRGRDRIFLISEPGLFKKDQVRTGNLKQVIITLQYTYTIHTMILIQFGINRAPFLNSSLVSLIFLIQPFF